MESIGTIHINVQKKFLKLWYNKKKITLKDISLILKQEESMMAHEEVSTGELVVISTNALEKESEVQSKEDVIKAREEMP